jgi:hypothetical protein
MEYRFRWLASEGNLKFSTDFKDQITDKPVPAHGELKKSC